MKERLIQIASFLCGALLGALLGIILWSFALPIVSDLASAIITIVFAILSGTSTLILKNRYRHPEKTDYTRW
ncbi:MAG: hypothetical protein B9S32_00305 [Verrucomicrobia bacterium Tous-C9LFEB]|nr:MAG: hypothetical protein B9S32_00305 [Verrucomicrobia bacterium Tous-C9LFEB]